MSVTRRTILGAASLVLARAGAGSAAGRDLVFTSWGGTTQDAQKAAWADKFTAASGTNVVQDGPTDYGKLKAMVEANAVNWDVVDVEGDYAAQAGKAGLLENFACSGGDSSFLVCIVGRCDWTRRKSYLQPQLSIATLWSSPQLEWMRGDSERYCLGLRTIVRNRKAVK